MEHQLVTRTAIWTIVLPLHSPLIAILCECAQPSEVRCHCCHFIQKETGSARSPNPELLYPPTLKPRANPSPGRGCWEEPLLSLLPQPGSTPG